TCILNITIAVSHRSSILWKEFFRITLFMCIGIPFGVFALKALPVSTLKAILGVFMILIGTYGLLKLRIPAVENIKLGNVAQITCLILGGLVQGAISSGGGSFIILYAQQRISDKQEFRATLSLMWSVISVITAIQYFVFKTLTAEAVNLFLWGILPAMLGIIVGGKICYKLSKTTFAYIVNILIISAGIFNLLSLVGIL
ncbi:MAG: sulfite exporter TauE/SafE family protein, partial [Oscillospiraceae bacterium]